MLFRYEFRELRYKIETRQHIGVDRGRGKARLSEASNEPSDEALQLEHHNH